MGDMGDIIAGTIAVILAAVLLMPHIGSAAKETRVAMGFRALGNLDAILAGRGPGDRVT